MLRKALGARLAGVASSASACFPPAATHAISSSAVSTPRHSAVASVPSAHLLLASLALTRNNKHAFSKSSMTAVATEMTAGAATLSVSNAALFSTDAAASTDAKAPPRPPLTPKQMRIAARAAAAAAASNNNNPAGSGSAAAMSEDDLHASLTATVADTDVPDSSQAVRATVYSVQRARDFANHQTAYPSWSGPYASTPVRPTLSLDQYRAKYSALPPGARLEAEPPSTLCGRVVSTRQASKTLLFIDLAAHSLPMGPTLLPNNYDSSNNSNNNSINNSYNIATSSAPLSRQTVQIILSERRLTEESSALSQLIKRGDWIALTGFPGQSNTGELSLIATDVALLSPCLQPLPPRLTNPELRARERHVDLLVNQQATWHVFRTRALTNAAVRSYLTRSGFVEVETPTLWTQAGGASARPFITHSNALGGDSTPLTLRIAPELFLKQLVVGGIERVFELSKVFRNEGIDATHNPEFTSCEAYCAHADYTDMFTLTEELIRATVHSVNSNSSSSNDSNNSRGNNAHRDIASDNASTATAADSVFGGPQGLIVRLPLHSGANVDKAVTGNPAIRYLNTSTNTNSNNSVSSSDASVNKAKSNNKSTSHTNGSHSSSAGSASAVFNAVQQLQQHSSSQQQPWVEIDFSQPFARIDILPALASFGVQLPEDVNRPESLPDLIAAAKAVGLTVSKDAAVSNAKMLDLMISELLEPLCVAPTFLVHHPVCLSPLAKRHNTRPDVTERFELFINTKEYCNAYSELNRPLEQLHRFRAQQKDREGGDDEAHPVDTPFCEALETGLPPTAGWGLGIDRDVLYFPIMKPKHPHSAAESAGADRVSQMSQLTRSVHQLDENAGRTAAQPMLQKPAARLVGGIQARPAPAGGVFKPLAAGAAPTRTAFRDISNVAPAPAPVNNALKKPVATQQYAPAAAPAPVHYAAPVGAPMTDDDFHYTAQAPVQQLQQQAPAPQMARQATFEDLSLRSAAAPVPAPMAAPCAPAFSDDLRNPQMVSVYVDQIMAHLRASETRHRPNEAYMSMQTDINPKMREILIDWLVEVHLKFKLHQETLFLTVNIIDRFLSLRPIQRNKLQLVGCTAMLIAAKYEEIYAPEVQDFVFVSDRAYTREQILSMESVILNELKFNVTVPYAMRFSERHVRVLRHTPEFKELVNFLIELTLQDYKFLKYTASMVGASAVSLALHLTGQPSWNEELQRDAQYTEHDIRACVLDLWHLSARDNPKYRAVRRKYSASKYHGVARITIVAPEEEPVRA